MEATITDTARAEARRTRRTPWALLRSWGSALAGALAEGARDESLDRLFTTSTAAQFAALPRSQQDRVLDRGVRPSH